MRIDVYMSRCKHCGCKEIIVFKDYDLIENIAYARYECVRCGYYEIINQNYSVISIGKNKPMLDI